VKILGIIVEVLEGDERKVVGMRFINLYLERSTKIIHCIMYLESQNIYLKIGYGG
jgi:hypothetical protein